MVLVTQDLLIKIAILLKNITAILFFCGFLHKICFVNVSRGVLKEKSTPKCSRMPGFWKHGGFREQQVIKKNIYI